MNPGNSKCLLSGLGSFIVLSCIAMALICPESAALDAKHIVCVSPRVDSAISPREICCGAHASYRIVLSTIRGTTITADTLDTLQIENPQFNFSGTKFACWRRVAGTWRLSVMDLATRKFTDLIDCAAWGAAPAATSDMEGINWPAGDWIYFEKPSFTGEVWKINSADTSKKQYVAGYNNWVSGKRLMNLYITPDVRIASVCLGTTGFEGWSSIMPIHHFPPTGDPTKAPDLIFDLPNCNPALSPSGEWAERFWNGMHEQMVVYQWNPATKTYDIANVGVCNSPNTTGCIQTSGDMEVWSGKTDWICIFEGPAWSINSDRWMTVRTSLPSNCNDFNQGSNAIIFSWKDKLALDITHHSAPRIALSGGCLFVEGGGPNTYQDVNGVWRDIFSKQAAPAKNPASSDSRRIRPVQMGGGICHIAINRPGHHTVSIADACGRICYARNGSGVTEYAADLNTVRPGIYVVTVGGGTPPTATRIVRQ